MNNRGNYVRFDGFEANPSQRELLWAWLQANGCRWQVSADAVIVAYGQHVYVPCWNIRAVRQAHTLWPRVLPADWEIPVKVRKFRIRVPLPRGLRQAG